MARARRNPIGLPVQRDVELVRVGDGEHTHVLHPSKMVHICESGVGRGAKDLHPTDATYVTCYRCSKLAAMNLAAGRPAWMGPRG
jgi:hypothetical protein